MGTGPDRPGGGLYLDGRDHGSVGYRVPKEWATLSDDQRGRGPWRGLRGSQGRGSSGGMVSWSVRTVGVLCVRMLGKMGLGDRARPCFGGTSEVKVEKQVGGG